MENTFNKPKSRINIMKSLDVRRDWFIAKAKEKYGDQYGYSLAEKDYVDNSTKVRIFCHSHGEFLQIPKSFLNGFACKKCSGSVMGETKFVQRALEIHGDTYDYSDLNYVNSTTKVKINCSTHGDFFQSPSKHLKGSGCRKCGFEKISNANSMTWKEFVERANVIHESAFIYHKPKIFKPKQKIDIECKHHGIFKQKAHSHLEGTTCPYCCGVIRTTERFIEKANLVHYNLYSYHNSIYKNSLSKIIVTCSLHGDFSVCSSDHLRGSGCPGCTSSHPERVWLDYLGITIRQYRIDISPTRYIKVDGFDPLTNTVYEFLGDFWHGNPNLYSSDEINRVNGKTHGQLYQETIERQELLKSMGYKVVTMWENDWLSVKDRKRNRNRLYGKGLKSGEANKHAATLVL